MVDGRKEMEAAIAKTKEEGRVEREAAMASCTQG
jgi:hypothetical protein